MYTLNRFNKKAKITNQKTPKTKQQHAAQKIVRLRYWEYTNSVKPGEQLLKATFKKKKKKNYKKNLLIGRRYGLTQDCTWTELTKLTKTK